jgi:uncharacterized membrane protein
MLHRVLRFVHLLLVALVVGTLFGIWIGFDPHYLSAQTYVEQQQRTIESLGILMPILGGITILSTLLLAALERRRRTVFLLLVAAAVLLIFVGLVTRFENQPINAQVMTWRAQAAPANWAELRDAWWKWHGVRTVAGLGALLLVLGATVAERRES